MNKVCYINKKRRIIYKLWIHIGVINKTFIQILTICPIQLKNLGNNQFNTMNINYYLKKINPKGIK